MTASKIDGIGRFGTLKVMVVGEIVPAKVREPEQATEEEGGE